jgi:hypothetical protein
MNDSPHQNGNPANHANTQPGEAVEAEECDKTSDKRHRAQEQEHWAHEKWINKVTVAVASVALGAAMLSAYFSHESMIAAIKAANEASRQADAAFADLRPWLQVELTLVQLRFADNLDANISYALRTKNVGKSPARNIQLRIEGSAVIEDSAINSIPNQKRLCDAAEKDAEQARCPGAFIYAGETGVGTLGIAGGGAVVGHEQYATAWPGADNVVMQIIGCFDYTLPSEKHGQVGFTYRLGRKIPDGSGHLSGFRPSPGIIPIGDISFDRDPFSGGYFK